MRWVSHVAQGRSAAQIADLGVGMADQAMALAGLTVLDLAIGGEFEALFSARLGLHLGHFASPSGRSPGCCLEPPRHALSPVGSTLCRCMIFSQNRFPLLRIMHQEGGVLYVRRGLLQAEPRFNLISLHYVANTPAISREWPGICGIKPPRPYRRNSVFRKGELLNAAIDTPRTANQPLTAFDLARSALGRKGVLQPDDRAVDQVGRGLRICLVRYRKVSMAVH